MASAVYREIGLQIRRSDYRVMHGRTIVPTARFASAAAGSLLASAWSELNERFPLKSLSAENFLFQPQPQELIMSDAKYLLLPRSVPDRIYGKRFIFVGNAQSKGRFLQFTSADLRGGQLRNWNRD